MNEPSDPIAKIQSLANSSRTMEPELREALESLGKQLVDACDGIDVSARSKECIFDECPPINQWTRGYFSFGPEGIYIFHRSNDDADNQQFDPDGPSYDGMKINECPIGWLETLLKNSCLKDLASRIGESLSQQNELRRLLIDGVNALAKTPFLAVSSSFERAAEELGYSHAVEKWKDAQNEIFINPEDAITKASSLLETVAKHILTERNIEYQSSQKMHQLVTTAAGALGLALVHQASEELRNLCSGVVTIAQNLGALRNRQSTAHGSGPEHEALTATHARLAVNTSGIVATFLMERWLAKKEERSDNEAAHEKRPI